MVAPSASLLFLPPPFFSLFSLLLPSFTSTFDILRFIIRFLVPPYPLIPVLLMDHGDETDRQILLNLYFPALLPADDQPLMKPGTQG